MDKLSLVATARELLSRASPGEATVHVLSGRVRLVCARTDWDGRTGDLIAVPDEPHSLEAMETAAVLLTVAKRGQA